MDSSEETRRRRLHPLGRAARVVRPVGQPNDSVRTKLKEPAEVRPSGLPSDITPFLGRQDEIEQITNLFQGHRTVTVSGAPGAGKSRLAIEIGRRLNRAERLEISWVDVSEQKKVGDLLNSVARAMLSQVQDPPARVQDIAGQVGKDRRLVILDNFDRMAPASARIADALVRNCPHVTILATGRRALGIDGEAVWALGGLSTPPALHEGEPESLLKYEAVQLFMERARAVQPAFALSLENATAVGEICRRLDGLPLAVELAAGRLQALPTHSIAERLDDQFGVLLGGRKTGPPRHRSLQAAVEWTYNLLSEKEKTLLQRLSVFSGGWTLEAAEEICSGNPLSQGEVFELLQSLAAKSMVVFEASGAQERYRLIEALRQFGRNKLASRGEKPLRARHAHWFFVLAKHLEDHLSSPDRDDSLAATGEEIQNIEEALRWSLESGDPGDGLRLAGSLGVFWRIRGDFSGGRKWLEELLSRAPRAEARVRAKALWAAGILAAGQCDFSTAAARAEESLALCEKAGITKGIPYSLNLLAFVKIQNDRPPAAIPLLNKSAEVAREVDDETAIAWALVLRGTVHMFGGQNAQSLPFFREALLIAQQSNDDQTRAAALMGVGWAALSSGDFEKALRFLGEAETITRKLGDKYQRGEALSFLGEVARMMGDFRAAHRRLDECLALGNEVGSPYLVARSLSGMARLAQDEGKLMDATEHFEEAIYVARKAGLPFILVRCMEGLSQISDPGRKKALLEESLEVATAKEHHQAAANALYILGRTAQEEGDQQRAVALHHEALAMRSKIGDQEGLADSLRAVAGLTVKSRQDAAARLLGAADSLGHSGYCPCCANDEASVKEAVEIEQLEAAMAEGAALSEDAAVAYATRGRGQRVRPAYGWESLTPTELQVVDLVKDGLTNPQIGRQLFVSPRTVGAHLAHIFDKVGVKSRIELAQLASRQENFRQPL